MTIAHIVTLLATGVGAGFASGFLGVGGAFITTPVQYAVYTAMSIPTDMAIKLAFGTSLLVILPTAASGAWRHHKKGVVWWRAAAVMGGTGLACSFGGATLAAHLPGAALKIAFGAVALAVAVRMLVSPSSETKAEPEDKPWLWAVWAIPPGLVSGVLGIGGGVLMVPIMVLVLKFKMHDAVATSLAVMIFTSIGGVVGYIVNGIGVPNLPPHSIGYVNLLSGSLLAATSVGMAQVGAIAAHRLPTRQLGYGFVGMMFYIGLRMLGAFG
jgi:hypothetical protein